MIDIHQAELLCLFPAPQEDRHIPSKGSCKARYRNFCLQFGICELSDLGCSTWPEGPAAFASRNARSPLPQQRSRHLLPGLTPAQLTVICFHTLCWPKLSLSFNCRNACNQILLLRISRQILELLHSGLKAFIIGCSEDLECVGWKLYWANHARMDALSFVTCFQCTDLIIHWCNVTKQPLSRL